MRRLERGLEPDQGSLDRGTEGVGREWAGCSSRGAWVGKGKRRPSSSKEGRRTKGRNSDRMGWERGEEERSLSKAGCWD